MGNFQGNLFAFNSLDRDPNLRGENPMVVQLVDLDPNALVAGVITVDVDSPFGKGLGEVVGIQLMTTKAATNHALTGSVAAHASTAGKLTITLESTDDTATTNFTSIKALIYGIIHPNSPS